MTSKVSVPSIMIGIGAGFVSALLFASLVGGSLLTLPLFLASPLPLMVAGLGWGPHAVLAAGLTAIVILQVELSTPATLVHLGSAAVPALILTTLVGRRLPVGGRATWFPIGRIAMIAAVVMAIATLAGALAIGFDVAATAREVTATFHEALVSGGTPATDLPEAMALEPFVRASVRLMPAFFPAFWTLVLMLDLALAARIARRMGRLERPLEDPAMLTLSPWVGLIFAAGFAASFLPGSFGVMASIAAGASFAPLFLVGMAVLTVMTRPTDMRWILRASAYGLVLLFPIATLVMALVGLADLFLDLRRGGRPDGGRDGPMN